MPAARWHQRCHQDVADPLHTHLHPTTAERGPKHHVWRGTKQQIFSADRLRAGQVSWQPLACHKHLPPGLPSCYEKQKWSSKKEGVGKNASSPSPFLLTSLVPCSPVTGAGRNWNSIDNLSCSIPSFAFFFFSSLLHVSAWKRRNEDKEQRIELCRRPRDSSPSTSLTRELLHNTVFAPRPGQIQAGTFIWCNGRWCRNPSLYCQSSPALSQSTIPKLHLQVTWATSSLLPIS